MLKRSHNNLQLHLREKSNKDKIIKVDQVINLPTIQLIILLKCHQGVWKSKAIYRLEIDFLKSRKRTHDNTITEPTIPYISG